MFRVSDIHIDQQSVKVRLPVKKLKVGDIGLLFAYQGANSTQHTSIVPDREIEGHRIDRGMLAVLPLQVKPALWLVFKLGERFAVDLVYIDALAAKSESDNAFSRQRLAAFAPAKMLIGSKADDSALGADL